MKKNPITAIKDYLWDAIGVSGRLKVRAIKANVMKVVGQGLIAASCIVGMAAMVLGDIANGLVRMFA